MVSTVASGRFDGWSLYPLSMTYTVGDPAAEGFGAVLFAPPPPPHPTRPMPRAAAVIVASFIRASFGRLFALPAVPY